MIGIFAAMFSGVNARTRIESLVAIQSPRHFDRTGDVFDGGEELATDLRG
jgi:hypothetical protein